MLFGLHHQERAGFQVPRHGRGYNVPGHLVRLNNTGHLSQLIPNGQPQQVSWEGYEIPTRADGDAEYAIHRAVRFAYEKGYKDAEKHRGHHYSFEQALIKADKEDKEELKDRLMHEGKGKMLNSGVAGLRAREMREILKDAMGSCQRDQGGYKEGDHVRRDKSRTCGHHLRNPRRNQENHWKKSERICKCGCSEDTSPFESDEEGDYVYHN